MKMMNTDAQKVLASQSGKWALLVLVSAALLCIALTSVLTGLHLYRSPSGFDQTVLEERDRLKRKLQNIDDRTAEGWMYFRGRWYLESITEQSWNESRKFCQERGADLIIINSTEEQDFHSKFGGHRWIGLSEVEREGEWKWVDGSPLNTSFWRKGMPDDYLGGEDCAEVEYGFGRQNWNDLPCTKSLRCVCEKINGFI